MLPSLIVSLTAFPAGGPVAGTSSEMDRPLFYKTALTVGAPCVQKTSTLIESLNHRIEGHPANTPFEARFLYRKPQEVCNFHRFVPDPPFGAKQHIMLLRDSNQGLRGHYITTTIGTYSILAPIY